MKRRSLGLVLLSLALVWADSSSSSSSESSSEEDCHCGHGGGRGGHGRGSIDGYAGYGRFSMAGQRIDTQAFRLERLANKLDKLESRLESAGSVSEADHVAGLAARLRHIEGNGCDKDHPFSCGHGDHECISALKLCDGHYDCKNHHDEDEDVCKNIVHSGDSFKGRITGEKCLDVSDGDFTITITRNTIYDYFTSRISVGAMVTMAFDEGKYSHQEKVFKLEGHYIQGLKRLVLQPPPGKFMGIVCDFYIEDRADCRLTREASLDVCATVRVIRV